MNFPFQFFVALCLIVIVGCRPANYDTTSGPYLIKNRIILRSERVETIYRTHAIQDNKFLIRVPADDLNLHALEQTNSIRPVLLNPPNPNALGDYYDENEARRLQKMISEHAPSDFDQAKLKVWYVGPDTNDGGIYVFQSATNAYSLILISYN